MDQQFHSGSCILNVLLLFETWIVLEHEKQGQKQDSLFDTFWLMTFFESISLVGSQGITNLLLDDDNKGILLPYTFAALVSVIGILYIRKAPSISTAHHASVIGSYKKSFCAHVLRDKRVLILVLAQASVQFSVSAFWFLWAPMIVADGRDAPLSLIYPCFLVSRMLGSAAFPWFYGAMAPFPNEDSLTTAYIAAGLALSIVAYDYQEIGTLVILFCIFHASVGFILPSLARFRTMYLPNELRGGMMSFSLTLGNVPMFIFLIQGAYHGKHRKFNHSRPCSMWAFICRGLHSYAAAVEKTHPPKRPQSIEDDDKLQIQYRLGRCRVCSMLIFPSAFDYWILTVN
ncbi:molybdate-anion transporter [Hordeum vulgare]|nr:molybdate-anion transporter [Hordeum vulgare]